MKNSKALYVVVFSVVAAIFALFQFEVLPIHLIAGAPDDPSTAELTYIIDLASIIMAIGGCLVLLYWFRLPFVRKQLREATEAHIAKHLNARLVIWFVLMLISTVLYYEASFAHNPKYSIFILFVAGVFCWPSMPVIDEGKATLPADPKAEAQAELRPEETDEDEEESAD